MTITIESTGHSRGRGIARGTEGDRAWDSSRATAWAVVEFYARRRGCSVEVARKTLRASCSPATVTAVAPAMRRTGTGG